LNRHVLKSHSFSRECLNHHTLLSHSLISQELVELILCLLQSLVPSVAVVQETIHLSLAYPPRAVHYGLPPHEHNIPLTKKHEG
jgi:hypothetical protein